MAQIAIIGAGLTGLATAYFLEQNGIQDYAIFEQETTCGGLCRTVRNDGFTFDYTGHFLHCTDPEALSFLAKTIGNKSLERITRDSAIFSQNTFTAYPYQSNLYGLPTKTIAECIEGFVRKKRPTSMPRDSFAYWVLKNFGTGFAKHFFYPYQEKLLCHPVHTITKTWVNNFVPDTSLEKIIEGTIQVPQRTIGYNAHFYYPRTGGIDHLINSITPIISRPIALNHKAENIDARKRTIYFENGAQEQFEYLVSTMPLDHLLTSLNQPRYSRVADHLHCNYLLNINIGISRPSIVPHHWVYYPEKQYPFFRIGLPHLLTPTMAPAHHSSIAIEIAFRNKPRALRPIVVKTYEHMKKLFGVDKREIVHECILELPHAYVLYDRWRDHNLASILKDLASQHIYSTGRYGGWKYSSMQEAILDGMNTAYQIIKLQQTKREF